MLPIRMPVRPCHNTSRPASHLRGSPPGWTIIFPSGGKQHVYSKACLFKSKTKMKKHTHCHTLAIKNCNKSLTSRHSKIHAETTQQHGFNTGAAFGSQPATLQGFLTTMWLCGDLFPVRSWLLSVCQSMVVHDMMAVSRHVSRPVSLIAQIQLGRECSFSAKGAPCSFACGESVVATHWRLRCSDTGFPKLNMQTHPMVR